MTSIDEILFGTIAHGSEYYNDGRILESFAPVFWGYDEIYLKRAVRNASRRYPQRNYTVISYMSIKVDGTNSTFGIMATEDAKEEMYARIEALQGMYETGVVTILYM